MSNRISGNSMRNYIGTRASQPPNITFNDHRPNEFDRFNYEVGDLWLFTDPTPGTSLQELYYLASLANDGVTTIVGKQAKWVLLASGAVGNVSSFQLDIGTASPDLLGVVNLLAGTNTNTVGDNLNTMRVHLNDSILLPATTGPNAGVIALGTDLTNDRFMHNYGPLGNTFLGALSGNFTCTGILNTGIGNACLNILDNGSTNTVIGALAGGTLTNGNDNVAVGSAALSGVTTGSNNIAIGSSAGNNYTTESNNIAIGNQGVALDSGAIRTGTAGTQTSAYMAGITGVTTATFSANKVMSVGTDGQLGEVLLESDDASVAITQAASGAINFRATGGGGSGNPFAFSYVQDTGATGVQASSYLQLGDYVALTKIFDVGNNVFPGNGLGTGGFAYFTAPVTGKYYLEMYLQLTQQPTFGYGPKIVISSPSKTYQSTPSVFDVGDRYPANVAYTLVVDMDMGATAQFGFATTAGTVGFDGNTVFNINSTRISGFLIPESSNGGAFAQPFLGIQQADAIGVVGLPGTVYLLGAGAPINEVYDIGNNFTPGNGVGLEARFVAPETGVYEFTISAFSTNGSNDIAIGLNTPGISYFTNIPGSSISGVPSYIGGEKSFSVPLTAGNIVTFPVSAGRPLAGSNDSDIVAGFAGNTFISTASHDVTYIYGKRIG